jgi:hypothetical protein
LSREWCIFCSGICAKAVREVGKDFGDVSGVANCWNGTGVADVFCGATVAYFVLFVEEGWVMDGLRVRNVLSVRRVVSPLLVGALLLSLAGCFVQTKKDANGKENVDIQTPLGGMSVKTHNNDVQAKVGLPLYPGAVPEKGTKDDDSTADVNMNFGPFHMRVLAMGFTTTDSPDKVRDFYMKPLAQYGDVIVCKDKKPVGTAAKTSQGLTCADDNHVQTKVGDAGKVELSKGEVELKAGSPKRQHLVSYEAKNGGTKFGLVYLELPGDNDADDDKRDAN